MEKVNFPIFLGVCVFSAIAACCFGPKMKSLIYHCKVGASVASVSSQSFSRALFMVVSDSLIVNERINGDCPLFD